MSRKIDVCLDPRKCTKCDNAKVCYFGEFFQSLRSDCCPMKAAKHGCGACSYYESCIIKKFELKTQMVVGKNDVLPCVNKV